MYVLELVGVCIFFKLCHPVGFTQRRQDSCYGLPLCNGKSGLSKARDASQYYLNYNHTYADKEPYGDLTVVALKGYFMIHDAKVTQCDFFTINQKSLLIFCSEYQSKMLLNYFDNNKIEAGLDEAGRGCYAGPVFAAAVILPKDFSHPLLNDSKKLSEKQRDLLRPIIEKECVAFAVASVSNEEIDAINILQASFKAMHHSINQLKIKPELLLIDGNRFRPFEDILHHCIVKGDGKYTCIAAASILAKTYRDEYMLKAHDQYPQYKWNKNKGYGTADHREAIDKYGLCALHRKSFNIVPMQGRLFGNCNL